MTTKFYHQADLSSEPWLILPSDYSTVPFRYFLGFIHTAPLLHKFPFPTSWLMASFSLDCPVSYLPNVTVSLIGSIFKMYLKYNYLFTNFTVLNLLNLHFLSLRL